MILQPARQHRDRIIDAGERHQAEHQRPDDALGAEPVAQHQARDEDPDRPAGEDQVAEERDQRQPDREEIEIEEEQRQQRHRDDADREPDQAHDHQRDQEFDRLQRAHHQVAEIARPHLLEKRDRKAELAAEQDVPQDHRADQRAAGARKEPGVLRDVALQKAPGDDLQRRPIDQLQQPRPGRHQEIPVAQHHRLDAMRRNAAMRRAISLIDDRPLRYPAARDVEEHFLQRRRGCSAP